VAEGRDQPIDFTRVRLQSPSEIRLAATRGTRLAEITVPELGDSEGPVTGGLYCRRIFGADRSDRRGQMAVMKLAWPCSHIWFTGRSKFGRAAELLGMNKTSMFDVRSFKKELFLGDWIAGVWPLRSRWLTGTQELPAIGSPVAAVRRTPLVSQKPDPGLVGHLESNGLEESQGSEENSHLLRQTQVMGSMLRSACSKHLTHDAARLSDVAQRAAVLLRQERIKGASTSALGKACGLGMNLPSVVADMSMICTQDGEDGKDGVLEAIPHLVNDVASQMKDLGFKEEEVEWLLEYLFLSADEPSAADLAAVLGDAAREDLLQLWASLAMPGLKGDMSSKLRQLRYLIEGNVEEADAARALAAGRRLQTRALAALDVALRAFSLQEGEAASSGRTQGSVRSRFDVQPKEVFWYDTSMQPAAFHLEDVDSLRDRMRLSDAGRRLSTADVESHCAEVTEDTAHADEKPQYATSELAEADQAPSAVGAAPSGGLTTPTKKRSGLTKAAYYRRGQSASERWHIPQQDAVRPGQGGGAHLLEPGKALPLGFGSKVAQLCAIRPRPASTPKAVPVSMEVEGSLFAGSGGSALRQSLSAVEPWLRARELAQEASALHSATTVQERLQRSRRVGFVTEDVGHLELALSLNLVKQKATDLKRRVMMQACMHKHQFPEWMVFVEYPILPLALRESSDDMQDQISAKYVNIKLKGNQLEDAIAERLPDRVLRGRKFALQNELDNVIDNSRSAKDSGTDSLAKRLKGKKGRMRFNMLGKRVNYSARTVIVVNPKLRMDHCGLPIRIAKEIFKDFLLFVLGNEMDFRNLRVEERMSKFGELPRSRQIQLLKKAMHDGTEPRLVMLNRAPTLHKLGFQAFIPDLLEDGSSALQLHPLVCSPFNADFDGDTMTVHLALSPEAQAELKALMKPSRNLSSPADGEAVFGPTQDMVLGIYYLTADPHDLDVPALPFDSLKDVVDAHAEGGVVRNGRWVEVTHETIVTVPRDDVLQSAPLAERDDPKLSGEGETEVRTTVGRVIFFALVHCGYNSPKIPEKELLHNLEEELDRVLEKRMS